MAAITIPSASPSGWPVAGSGLAWSTARPTNSATNITENPVHIHDLNATILQCLGIDHRRLTYKYQGLDVRLTGVLDQNPVAGILA